MKITSNGLAWTCVILLVSYPIAAVLAWNHLIPGDDYGVLAALLAASAATALVVGVTFNSPQFSGYVPGQLKIMAGFIAFASGLASAVYWMTDEVEHLGLWSGFVALVLVVLLVLLWFVDTAVKEGKEKEEEAEAAKSDSEG